MPREAWFSLQDDNNDATYQSTGHKSVVTVAWGMYACATIVKLLQYKSSYRTQTIANDCGDKSSSLGGSSWWDDCTSFSLEIFKDAKKFSIPGLG